MPDARDTDRNGGPMTLADKKVGDKVTRMLAGAVPMKLQITEITDTKIVCGDWEFDKATGAEIDDLLGWGSPPLTTGSYITPEES